MTTPTRITLSRAKGFNLQAASMTLNGLPAVKVDRTTKFGNPFTVDGAREAGMSNAPKGAVYAFRDWLNGNFWACGSDRYEEKRAGILANIATLRGKNLACWCKKGQPCHADVLLEIANQPMCEEVK